MDVSVISDSSDTVVDLQGTSILTSYVNGTAFAGPRGAKRLALSVDIVLAVGSTITSVTLRLRYKNPAGRYANVPISYCAGDGTIVFAEGAEATFAGMAAGVGGAQYGATLWTASHFIGRDSLTVDVKTNSPGGVGDRIRCWWSTLS